MLFVTLHCLAHLSMHVQYIIQHAFFVAIFLEYSVYFFKIQENATFPEVSELCVGAVSSICASFSEVC